MGNLRNIPNPNHAFLSTGFRGFSSATTSFSALASRCGSLTSSEIACPSCAPANRFCLLRRSPSTNGNRGSGRSPFAAAKFGDAVPGAQRRIRTSDHRVLRAFRGLVHRGRSRTPEFGRRPTRSPRRARQAASFTVAPALRKSQSNARLSCAAKIVSRRVRKPRVTSYPKLPMEAPRLAGA